MSLSALQEDLTIFTPSLMIRDRFHRSNVQRDSRELAKSGKLFCPHCYASDGELRSVSFRSGGEFKRDHFFHPKSDLICHYSPMTEKHINAQAWVADHLSRKYPDALIKEEMQLRKSKDELCRPDICVILPDGTKFAYEIQVSKITEYEVKNRTEKLQSNGCKAVTWFFTDQSDSLLIQECLALKKQHHVLIYFEEDSSVASIAITDLKAVRRSLLRKLWDDYCLKEAKYWGMQSRLFDDHQFHYLMTHPAFSINMNLFFDVVTVKEFGLKAEEIYSAVIDNLRSQKRIEEIKKAAKRRITTPSNKALFNPKIVLAKYLTFFLNEEMLRQKEEDLRMEVFRVLAKSKKDIRIATPLNKMFFTPEIALAKCLVFFLYEEVQEITKAENFAKCSLAPNYKAISILSTIKDPSESPELIRDACLFVGWRLVSPTSWNYIDFRCGTKGVVTIDSLRSAVIAKTETIKSLVTAA